MKRFRRVSQSEISGKEPLFEIACEFPGLLFFAYTTEEDYLQRSGNDASDSDMEQTDGV